MKGDIQYPFALDETDSIISVHEIDREHRHDHRFSCPHCGRQMLPRLGEKREKHFYHSENQACGEESYIHKVAKMLLERRFNEKEKPFIIRYSPIVICNQSENCTLFRQERCSYRTNRERNLQKEYDLSAEIEPIVLSSHDVFRPDVCLRSSNPAFKDIFIEVWYKHKSSENKISSGYPIIEFHITSEQDLTALKTQETFSESPEIRFYNFNESTEQEAFHGSFASCRETSRSPQDASSSHQSEPNEEICEANDQTPPEPMFCRQCQNYGTWYDGAEFCRRNLDYSSRKGTFENSHAKECELYKFDYHQPADIPQ